MAITSKTFRIFVSSTFSDLKADRNALQENVFPKLRKLCTQNGFRFQAIDLRWGVREEAGLDQQTVRICLDEIVRCQQTTPRPNFIVLLGNRYGWQPLPYAIEATEFEALLHHIPQKENQDLLTSWYKQDDNSVPPMYLLQPRKVDIPQGATQEETKEAREMEGRDWNQTEKLLQTILRAAIKKLSPTDEQKIKYHASATDQEIRAGAMAVPDAEKHVYGFFRDISNIPGDITAKDYIDLTTEKNVDTEAQDKLKALKERLERKVGKDNIFHYQAHWTEQGSTTDHIKKLCDDVYSSLSAVIQQSIDELEEKDPLEQEKDAHTAFGQDRARVFIGRTQPLQKIQDYISGTEFHPLAVWGESGSGKSALMARAVAQTQKQHPETETIVRFIGATPGSSDVRTLLENLCRQISRCYGADEATIPTDYKELVEAFPKMLDLATEEKPLILFLDALDQLSDAHQARNLIWLPSDISKHVRIVASTLPGECLDALTRHPKVIRIELEPMPAAEGESLLDIWLQEAGRTLQKQQRNAVLEKFTKNGLPLYLKLAFEEAKRWKSYSSHTPLSPDIPGMIRNLYAHLSTDANHGQIMVSRSLSYMAAGKNGLSEDELIDVLSRDEDVFGDFKKRAFFKPPEQKLPVVVWSRLYFDLEPYLTERTADGDSLISFYHRQLGEVVKKDYLSDKVKKDRHQILAGYFGEQPLFSEKGEEQVPNLRKLSELPFQQTHGEMWDAVYETLADFEFLEAKCTHIAATTVGAGEDVRKTYGGVYELLEDYRRTLDNYPDSAPDEGEGEVLLRSAIEALFRAADQSSFVLKEDPGLTFPQLYNRLQWQAEQNEFLKQKLDFARKQFKNPWLHLLTRPVQSAALIRTLTGHTKDVNACAFSPDGSRIVSASSDGTLKLWDAITGKEIFTLRGHTHAVLACAFSPDGRRIVSGGPEKTLKLWDVKTGKEISTLKGHTGTVYACAFSPDGKRIVSGSEHLTYFGTDDIIKLWDAETRREIYTLRGHTQDVRALAFSPDGSRFVSGSEDKTLKLWDAKTGQEIATLKGHKSTVYSCAFSSDGSRIVSASWDDTLKLWDVKTQKEISTLKGHTRPVIDCTFSPDGRRIVSASWDYTLRLWDGESGEELSTLKSHNSFVTACSFSPDGKHIISGSADNTLKLWDAKTGEEISDIGGHTGWVQDCVFSPDGKQIVSASVDKTLKLWDGESGKEISTIKGHATRLYTCAFSLYGGRVLSGGHDKVLKLWDLKSGKEIYTYKGHTNEVKDCTFSPDGKRILSASGDNTLILWDAGKGKPIKTLKGHTDTACACAFSPDGKIIVSSSWDKTLRLWGGKKGRKIKTLRGHSKWVNDCAFSPDGQRLISASSDNTLIIWDGIKGKKIKVITGHTEGVDSCAFSPDGRHFASGSADKTLKLWHAETVEEICVLKGHAGTVFSCAFSPDGNRIVLGDTQGQVLLVSMENIDLLPAQVTPNIKSNKLFSFCPYCRKITLIDESSLGRESNCAQCGQTVKLNPFTVKLD